MNLFFIILLYYYLFHSYDGKEKQRVEARSDKEREKRKVRAVREREKERRGGSSLVLKRKIWVEQHSLNEYRIDLETGISRALALLAWRNWPGGSA